MSLLSTPPIDALTPEELWATNAETPSTLGQYTGESFMDTLKTSIFGVGTQVGPDYQPPMSGGIFGQPAVQQPSGTKALTEDEWKASKHYVPDIPYDPTMTEAKADFLKQQYDTRRWRDSVYERYQGGLGGKALGIAAMLAGGALAPENYIPILGPVSRAYMATRLGRVGAHVAAGSAEGVIGNLAVAPYVYQGLAAQGEDVGIEDVALDLAFGAILGGAFGGGMGVLADRGARARAMREAAISGRANAMNTAADALNLAADAVERGDAPDVARVVQGEIDRVRPPRVQVVEPDHADFAGSIARFASEAMADKQAVRRMHVGALAPETVALARGQAQVDLADFQLTVEAQAVRHAIQEHGTAATEVPRGQVPITPEDIARVPEIIAAADSVEFGETRKGLPALKFSRQINGREHVVTTVRRGKKHLAFESMWIRDKREGGPEGVSAPPDKGGPTTIRPERPQGPSENMPSTSPSGNPRPGFAPDATMRSLWDDPPPDAIDLPDGSFAEPDPRPIPPDPIPESVTTAAPRVGKSGDELQEFVEDLGLEDMSTIDMDLNELRRSGALTQADEKALEDAAVEAKVAADVAIAYESLATCVVRYGT